MTAPDDLILIGETDNLPDADGLVVILPDIAVLHDEDTRAAWQTPSL